MRGHKLRPHLVHSSRALPFVLGCVLAGPPALAQGTVVSPGNIAPGSRGIASAPAGDLLPQGSPIVRVLPTAPPAVSASPGIAPASAAPVPSGASSISSLRIDGATAFSAAETAPLTAGLIGRAVPFSRIEAARTGLLNLYRGHGYALTSVTATVEPGGLLKFTVIEGRIEEVKLEGDIGPAGTQVLRFLEHLKELRPLDTASLERWLLLAQDVPGIMLRAVLRPSSGEPGALTLIAQVERQKVAGLLNIDNRASRYTGPIEGLALVDLNSFTEFGERTEATIYHTDANTQNFGQLTEEVFLGGSGLRGRVYGGYGEANPSGYLRQTDYRGTTTVAGGSLTYPLIRARQETLNVSGYLDAIETQITQVSVTGTGLQRGFDSLRVGRLGSDFAQQDGIFGDERPGISTINVRLSQGIPSLGATKSGNVQATRPGERTDFTKFVADISRVQTLFQLPSNSSVAIKARVIGQYSGNILPPAEKFFLGGPEFNRGFYAGEVTGDNAFVWQAELQYNKTYDLQAFNRTFNLSAQFYAFYDRGEAWQNTSPQVETPYTRLSSMGLGLRLNVTRFTEFNIEGVHRNTRSVDGPSPSVSPLKADAAYWRVIVRF